jgi:uncharacterized small protein (DUF1192 family)
MSLLTRTAALSALLLSTVLATGCAPPDDAEDAPSSDDALSTGTRRRERYVLLQAEVDKAQADLFRSYPSGVVVSSYSAGIYWAKPDRVPSVQKQFEDEMDAAIAKVDADIAKLEAQKPGYEETIVLGLGGHSTGWSFFGHSQTSEGNTNYARIQPEKVQELASKYPRFGKNVRGLFLLGCNAGHRDRMDLWRRPFPNVVAVAGFNSRAPSGDNGSNMMVKMSLSGWQRLGVLNAGAQLPTDDASLFKALSDCRASKCLGSITPTTYGFVVNSSPAWELVVNGAPRWDAVYAPDGSATIQAELQRLQTEYDAYLSAKDDAHANPPADTGTGMLRQYNNKAQQYVAALAHEGRTASAADMKRVQQSIRLTLFRDVLAGWVDANEAVVRAVGLDPDALVVKSRKAVLEAIRALPAPKLSSPEGRRVVRALIDLDAAEVPDTML